MAGGRSARFASYLKLPSKSVQTHEIIIIIIIKTPLIQARNLDSATGAVALGLLPHY